MDMDDLYAMLRVALMIASLLIIITIIGYIYVAVVYADNPLEGFLTIILG